MDTAILYVAAALYLITAYFSFKTAKFWQSTVNGELRLRLISLFRYITIGLTLRGLWGFFPLDTRIIINPYVSIISIAIVGYGIIKFYYCIVYEAKKK